MTPNFAVVRIQNLVASPMDRSAWSFWGFPFVVPLFLLWIPAILLAPFVFIVLWPVCIAVEISFTQTVSTFWNLLCGLPGTDVRVCAEGKRITVRIL
jgi:hypothetical protein